MVIRCYAGFPEILKADFSPMEVENDFDLLKVVVRKKKQHAPQMVVYM